jgi:hypothetical protein
VFYVDKQTNIGRPTQSLHELDKLQGQLNGHDVDQVVDLVMVGLLDKDLAETTHPQCSKARQLGLPLVVRTS